MKEIFGRKSRIISVILCIVIVMLLSVFINTENSSHRTSNSPIDLAEGWKMRYGDSPIKSNGTPLWAVEDFSSPEWKPYRWGGQKIELQDGRNYVWFSVKLPADKWENATLFFDHMVGSAFEVYLGDECLFSEKPRGLESKDFMDNASRLLIPLGSNYQGKTLTIRIPLQYEKVGPRVRVLMGAHQDLININLRADVSNLILGFFFFIFGIIMLPILVFLNRDERKSLMSLSFFIISLGVWLLSQYFILNPVIQAANITWHFLFILSILLAVTFLLYFFGQIFGKGYEEAVKKLWQSQIVIVVIYIALFTLTVTTSLPVGKLIVRLFSLYSLLLVLVFAFIIFVIVKNALKGDIDALIFTTGFVIFTIVAIFEFVMTTFNPRYWTPIVSKWSMLFFFVSLVLILGRKFFDVHRRLVVYSNELESKNEALNDMVKEVKDSKNEIEKLNKTLEQRVIERTQQLESALDTLIRTQDQLVQSEKMASLGGLVAGVAHEINTPLGIGVTAASHLEKKTIEISNLYNENKMKKSSFEDFLSMNRELTDIILINLKGASDLVKSFKMVAVDQSSEERRKFKLSQYINDVLLSLSPSIKKTKHQINVDCPEDLEIDGYPGAFSQIVTNLVMNSLIHAYREDEEGNISFNIEKKDNNIIIEYSDDGKGIEKENLDRIYDPFFTTKRHKGGTGLGLNILYNIVTQKFKGTIKCSSELGKGTKFTIEFPAI